MKDKMIKITLPQKTVKSYLNNLSIYDLAGPTVAEYHFDDIQFFMAVALYGKDLVGYHYGPEKDGYIPVQFEGMPEQCFFVNNKKVVF